jgi:Chlorophyllase
MPESEHTLSRRRLLEIAGLGTAAAFGACALSATPAALPLTTPTLSPAALGRYQTKKLILGEDVGTTAMPNPFTLAQMPQWALGLDGTLFNAVCRDGKLVEAGELPRQVLAAVFYPFDPRDHRAIPTPNPLGMSKGPYPLLLYAHGFRLPTEACRVASPINRDFTTVETMLRHVASWGCVCVAPDLSWLPGILFRNDPVVERDAFDLRAVVLADYLTYLADVLNNTLFAKQLDFSRVVLVGHSTGAGGATHAGSIISGFGHPTSVSYGLIAPVAKPANSAVRNLLVLGGGQDTLQGADPLGAFTAGGTPKTLATIPGANHFGYTDLCDASNRCEPFGVADPNGTISRAQQQLAGAAYLTALLRFYALGDATARPYLTGQLAVEGLESLSITVQTKGFVTRPTPPVVPTTTHTPVVQP